MKRTFILFFLFCVINVHSNNDTSLSKSVIKIKNESFIENRKIVKDTLLIKTQEPVLIKEIKDESTSIWDWIVRFGGILGLLVAVLTIYEKLYSKPIITSKIISFACGDLQEINMPNYSGVRNTIGSGIRFFLKLSINIVNNNLNFRTIDILVKFKNDPKIYIALKYAPRNFNLWKQGNESKILELPQNELLFYQTNIEKDKTHQLYATFLIIDEGKFFETGSKNLKKEYKLPEYIQLRFISSKKTWILNKQIIFMTNKMRINDLRPEEYLFEENIWRTI